MKTILSFLYDGMTINTGYGDEVYVNNKKDL